MEEWESEEWKLSNYSHRMIENAKAKVNNEKKRQIIRKALKEDPEFRKRIAQSMSIKSEDWVGNRHKPDKFESPNDWDSESL